MPLASPGMQYYTLSRIASNTRSNAATLKAAMESLFTSYCMNTNVSTKLIALNNIIAVDADALAPDGSIIHDLLGIVVADATGCKLPPPMCIESNGRIIVTLRRVAIIPPEGGTVSVTRCLPVV